MKSLLIFLLLLVFSAQGVTVAMGGNGQMHAGGVHLEESGPDADGLLDAGLSDVAADMEEMSDYVALELTFRDVDQRATPIRLPLPPLVSIDLPRAPPPPKV